MGEVNFGYFEYEAINVLISTFASHSALAR
jgi:hypothetical protein